MYFLKLNREAIAALYNCIEIAKAQSYSYSPQEYSDYYYMNETLHRLGQGQPIEPLRFDFNSDYNQKIKKIFEPILPHLTKVESWQINTYQTNAVVRSYPQLALLDACEKYLVEANRASNILSNIAKEEKSPGFYDQQIQVSQARHNVLNAINYMKKGLPISTLYVNGINMELHRIGRFPLMSIPIIAGSILHPNPAQSSSLFYFEHFKKTENPPKPEANISLPPVNPKASM